jgi:hypothetical protein
MTCTVGNRQEKFRNDLSSWKVGFEYRDPYYVIVAIHRSSEVNLGPEQGFPVANRWQCPRLLGALPGLYLVRPCMIYTASLMQGMLHLGAVGKDPRSQGKVLCVMVSRTRRS